MERVWHDAKRQGWMPVELGFPNTGEEVEVIGKVYEHYSVDIATAKFNPKSGWHSRFNTIYAWRRTPDILDELKAKYPARE